MPRLVRSTLRGNEARSFSHDHVAVNGYYLNLMTSFEYEIGDSTMALGFKSDQEKTYYLSSEL
jgi:hypothetical protein